MMNAVDGFIAGFSGFVCMMGMTGAMNAVDGFTAEFPGLVRMIGELKQDAAIAFVS